MLMMKMMMAIAGAREGGVGTREAHLLQRRRCVNLGNIRDMESMYRDRLKGFGRVV